MAGLQTLLIFLVIFLLLVIYYLKDLPTPGRLQKRISVESTKIFDRNGQLLYTIYGEENRIILSKDEIPKIIKEGTIVVEDKNFYRHFGLDFRGILRAAIHDLFHLGRGLQGGSTLTQQFVKNTLIASPKRTLSRKIKEAILAMEVELFYSKDAILTMYLNQIPYGSNAYGIEAAARTYFNKHAKDLSLAEAAVLIALPKAPTYYSPYGTHTDELFARKNYVLDKMAEQGYITKAQAEAAKKEKLHFVPRRESILAPHFVMYVRELLTSKYGERLVSTGGLKVTTTLDLNQQKLAEEVINKWGPLNEKRAGAKNAALIALDPKTGQILAMVGSRDYFNPAIDGNVNVTTAKRQPGSAFKPIVYATAFQDEWAPASVLFDLETDFGGGYIPKNYDGKTRGPVTIRTALSNSLNIPAVKMLALVGIDRVLNQARNFGITTLNRGKEAYGLSLVLGSGEVKLLELANAYAVFANEGYYHPPTAILKVEDQKGQVIEQWQPDQGREVIEPEIAYEISSILSDNNARAPVFGTRSWLYIPGKTVAAKTGTTTAYRDAWTLGYTPSLVTGVWVGNNDNSPMSNYRGAGAMVAAPIFHDFMTAALAKKPNEEFPRPSSIKEIEVDALTGKLPIPGGPTRRDIFAPWQIPKERAFAKTIVKIDKICGDKLATDLTPPEYVEERIYRVIHSEMPDNPNWEAPVRAWAVAHGYTDQPPTEYCLIHSPENQPKIQITQPTNNASVSGILNIQTNLSAPNGVKQVEFYLDEILFATVTNPPFAATYDTKNLSLGAHTLSVILYDRAGFKAKDSVTFNVEQDSQPPSSPSNLSGSRSGSNVVLSWSAASDNLGLAGYFVYRSSDGVNFSKINSTPLQTTGYSDLPPAFGVYYYVTAVDTAGNESHKSNTIGPL